MQKNSRDTYRLGVTARCAKCGNMAVPVSVNYLERNQQNAYVMVDTQLTTEDVKMPRNDRK
jgi:hypothetical protein